MRIIHHQFIIFTALFATTFSAEAQTNISSGTQLKVLPGTKLSTNDLFIERGAIADIAGTINLKGDLVKNGDLLLDGQLTFSGKSIQTVEGSLPFEAAKIEINNPSGVEFKIGVTVLDSLKLLKGKLNISTSTALFFSQTAKNPVETSDSYIEGLVTMKERHVGSNSLPLFLGCAISPGSDIGVVSIDRVTGPEGIITKGTYESIASKWTIRTSIETKVADRDVLFQWLPEFDNNKNIIDIDLYGTDIGDNTYSKLNNQSITMPLTGMRRFYKSNVGKFNRVFTLSDGKNPLRDIPVPQGISRIFPNPFFDHITIDFENSKGFPVIVKFISGTGQVAHFATVPSVNNRIEVKDIEYLPQGNYWLQIQVDGYTFSAQITKIR